MRTTLTLREAFARIGSTATLTTAEGLRVAVVLLDAKSAWGNLRFQVRGSMPDDGIADRLTLDSRPTAWVDAARIEVQS